MRIVAVVPAKGSSDRVPNKNLKILGGEPLFLRKIRQLLECDLIDEVWLDTDSQELIDLAIHLPIKILKRIPSLATNDADGNDIFQNACNHIKNADIVVQALCTAPFVDHKTIERALNLLINSPRNDSLVATYSRKQYIWENGKPNYLINGRIPNSSTLPQTHIEAMSLYVVRSTSSKFPMFRIGENPIAFELKSEEILDIDDLGDFELAQKVADAEILKEAQKFSIYKLGLTSSMLSDILVDMNLKSVLPQVIKPVSNGKILGRAKTLKLRSLTPREIEGQKEWEGIYKALSSYEYIRTGDIIVVATDVKERAYFGDLNAHLAIRAGAAGVVVDGLTRDIQNVRGFGFPVYAHGTWCNDIKYCGTTQEINMPVQIGECIINNRDIIFGDEDGVVCIPSHLWDIILNKALNTIKIESHIKIDTMLGEPINNILSSRGVF